MKRYNGLAVWGAVAAAVAIGGLLVSPKAPGGSLDPTDTPSSTMHSLDEIYANTRGVVVPPEALATVRGPAFLLVQGIPGDASKAGYEGWITMYGLEHSTEVTGYGGTGAPDVNMAALTVIKQLDSASPKLSLACCEGTLLPTVRVELLSNDQQAVVHRIWLQNAILVRMAPRLVNRGDGLVLMEELSFRFEKITWEFVTGPGTGVKTYWSVTENRGGEL